MLRLNRLSLRARLALAFSLPAAVTLLALGAYLHGLLRSQVLEATEQRLRAEARLAAARLAERYPAPDPELQAWVAELARHSDARVTVVEPVGRVLADSEADPATMDNHAWRPEIIRAREEGWGSALRRSPTLGYPHLYVALLAGTDPEAPVLRLAVPVTALSRATGALSRTLLIAFALALVFIVLVSARLSAWLTDSLGVLAAVARRVGRGDLQARVASPLPGELAELGEVLNRALDSLSEQVNFAQRESRRFGALLEQMSDAVVVVDAADRVQLVNRAFCERFEVDPQSAVGRHVEEVTLHYELSLLLSRAVRQGAPQQGELRLLGADPRLLYAAVTPLSGAGGERLGAVALLRDVTELYRADQVRRDFVANASHELRTPAAGIRALAEVLHEGALADTERAPRFVAQIVTEADRLTRILDDMLTLTRVERGQELLHPRRQSAGEACDEAEAQVRAAAMAKGVELSLEVGEGDEVYADPAALQTILVNLLDNAVKYTPRGGRVRLQGRPTPAGYELSVADTGVGIPAEHQPRIFERFYRVDKARDRATGGTGLGLSIVKHVAETHGGRVSVRSALGEGSVFTVLLPAPPASPAASQ